MRAFEELSEGDRLCFRALTLAARAAHIGNREEEAVTLFRRAGQLQRPTLSCGKPVGAY